MKESDLPLAESTDIGRVTGEAEKIVRESYRRDTESYWRKAGRFAFSCLVSTDFATYGAPPENTDNTPQSEEI